MTNLQAKEYLEAHVTEVVVDITDDGARMWRYDPMLKVTQVYEEGCWSRANLDVYFKNQTFYRLEEKAL